MQATPCPITGNPYRNYCGGHIGMFYLYIYLFFIIKSYKNYIKSNKICFQKATALNYLGLI